MPSSARKPATRYRRSMMRGKPTFFLRARANTKTDIVPPGGRDARPYGIPLIPTFLMRRRFGRLIAAPTERSEWNGFLLRQCHLVRVILRSIATKNPVPIATNHGILRLREAMTGLNLITLPLAGTSKNSGLVMRREILFQIEGQKTQESFVAFKFFARKAGTKDPA